MGFKSSNLEILIDALRLQIGDTGVTMTYSDESLHSTLKYAVNALMRRWQNRYYLDSENVVQRNTINCYFDFASPPVIQRQDERAIVLMGAIIIKGGKKFSTASDVVSWKDDEVAYSNIESSRQTASSLSDDIKELELLLPSKRLARSISGRLEGYAREY